MGCLPYVLCANGSRAKTARHDIATKEKTGNPLSASGLEFRSSLLALLQRAQARIDRVLAEQLLDAQELVVFRQTVGAAEGTVLIWPQFVATAMSAANIECSKNAGIFVLFTSFFRID